MWMVKLKPYITGK